ncbi:MAG: Fic family protein, partial [Thaumarchaeota archaeon]
SKYLPPPAYEVPFLVEQMVDHLNSNPFRLDSIELALKAHLWLVSIHPFRDGNGRVARLLMGLILLRGGYPPAIVRREHRRRYLSVIEKAQIRLDLKPYYDFMAQELLTTMNTYLSMIKQQKAGG